MCPQIPGYQGDAGEIEDREIGCKPNSLPGKEQNGRMGETCNLNFIKEIV